MAAHMNNQFLKVRTLTIFCIFLLLCMLSISTGQCRPSKHKHNKSHQNLHTKQQQQTLDQETIDQLKPCFSNGTIMELCQHCAKESKASNVFPLCCSNVNGVRDWCHDYIYFGL